MTRVSPTLAECYDAVVVGAGATGGWAAKRLAEAGLRVVLLDAGRDVTASELAERSRVSQGESAKLPPDIARTRPIQKACYACQPHNYDWFVDDGEHPYTTAPDRPFSWQRLRAVGGRTLVWGRQCYRMSDLDFRAATHDGYGEDWPLSYADVAPYYDEVERYLGIAGLAESHPALPHGELLPAPPMSPREHQFRERVAAELGRTVTVGRLSLPYPAGVRSAAAPPVAFPLATVHDALATGCCTLVTDVIVSHVTMHDAHRARGVACVHRHSRETFEIAARAVILCAQALESTRILLNSASPDHPRGLGSSSGVLGRYLMDHVSGAGASGELDGDDTAPSPHGIYVIRFRNLAGEPPHPGFLRGYGYQGQMVPSFDFDGGASTTEGAGRLRLIAFGESLARDDNRVTIDPDLRDAWGIPALRIHMSHGPNEKAMMRDAAEQAARMLEAAGARNVVASPKMTTPGMAVHELGTARMGDDPARSVLDAFNGLHDAPNVYVMDGACFVSSGCQNPTLTMMALTLRACDRLIERFGAGGV
jgi:choline dehydrogenase-like flavoprotein